MTFALENDALRLEFDEVYGTLINLAVPARHWDIVQQSSVGLSFALLVPLPNRRNNRVMGEQQRLTAFAQPDDHHAIFVWDEVTSQHGGKHAIRIELTVTLGDQHATFAMTIANGSEWPVENVWYPMLTDVQPPPNSSRLCACLPSNNAADVYPLYPTFQNTLGYWGTDYPTQVHRAAPQAPFVLVQGEEEGLSLSLATPDFSLVAWQMELRPGYANSLGDQVPDENTIDGHVVGIRCAAVHVPFITPGETRALTPIALTPFVGTWAEGARHYRAQRAEWMTAAKAPAWAREPHAWQQIQFNTPEDDLRHRFSDLVEIGQACAQHGVKAIQLVGWNEGGQDQNNPSHRPDPRLGTPDELRSAIAQVQALGVKVILFAKFTWADRATDRYRADLVRYAIKDPYGDPYVYAGYQYQTATQLLDINTKRFTPMCFLSEGYLAVCEAEFRDLLSLGAAGMLYDESQHHNPALLCFAEDHGHRRGAPVYAHDRLLIERLRTISTEAGYPDFLFAGESCYDWEFAAYHLSYLRSASRDHIPMTRWLHPQAQLMTAVTGFDDRNLLNQCLLYRYIISYEPFNFKGRLADFPRTVTYGQAVDGLRTELRGYFWDGEFCHEAGVRVTTLDGKPHHPFAVYRHSTTGHIGVAIANYDAVPMDVLISQDTQAPLVRSRIVGTAAWLPMADQVSLPAYSAVVVLPQVN